MSFNNLIKNIINILIKKAMSEASQSHFLVSEELQTRTMAFIDPKLEEFYVTMRTHNMVNVYMKALVIFIGVVILLRRLQILIESYTDMSMLSHNEEIRLFCISIVATGIELLTHVIKRLHFLRCFMMVAIIYYTAADSSVTYYISRVNDEPVYAFG